MAPGTYTVRIEELAESTPAERRLVEAERLMTEAAARNREGKAESLRLAAVRYGEARVRWRSLGNRREEARCALSAGGIHMSLGEPKEALEDYRQALAPGLFTMTMLFGLHPLLALAVASLLAWLLSRVMIRPATACPPQNSMTPRQWVSRAYGELAPGRSGCPSWAHW